MASVWNGKELQASYAEEAGYGDSKSLARTLKYINDIQTEIATSADWANLKFKLQKIISSDSQKFDISPQVPEAPSIELSTDGTLTAGKECKVKVTFVIFDEEKQEYSSIESEPSPASNSVTTSAGNQKIKLTNIPSLEGDYDSEMVHRRIYLKIGSEPYFLAATIKENDSNTATIDAIPSSTIEPPEQSMVDHLSAEDIAIHAGSRVLVEASIDDIQKYDPALSSVGTPVYYARISDTKILIYPRPSSDITISYWIKRRPSRIFPEEDRSIQLSRSLENVLEVGVTWKWMKYKQDADWSQMYDLYRELKSQAKAEKVLKGGQFSKVRVVC
jgi:hypothetical protein